MEHLNKIMSKLKQLTELRNVSSVSGKCKGLKLIIIKINVKSTLSNNAHFQ